jgi:hypothetical protein
MFAMRGGKMLEGRAIRRDPNGASVRTQTALRSLKPPPDQQMTAKRKNGAEDAPDPVSSMVAMMQGPTANTFLVSQRFALEAARFWARRMHAYADQMELLASCKSPDELAGVQTRFIERLRDDYAAETQAFTALLTPERGGDGEESRT